MYGVARERCFAVSRCSPDGERLEIPLLVLCEAFAWRTAMDCQVLNEHTASLGAVEIPRRHYLIS
ncbi:hypothetical protein ACNKHO_05465 [Shigella flexneri]